MRFLLLICTGGLLSGSWHAMSPVYIIFTSHAPGIHSERHTNGCRAPSAVPPVSPEGGGPQLPDGPAPEQVDNRQENDGPQQRDQERGEAEIVLIDGANAEVLPPVAKCTKTTGLKMY